MHQDSILEPAGDLRLLPSELASHHLRTLRAKARYEGLPLVWVVVRLRPSEENPVLGWHPEV